MILGCVAICSIKVKQSFLFLKVIYIQMIIFFISADEWLFNGNEGGKVR